MDCKKIDKIFIYILIFTLVKCKTITYPESIDTDVNKNFKKENKKSIRSYPITDTSSFPSFCKESAKHKLDYIPEKMHIKTIDTGFSILKRVIKTFNQFKNIDNIGSQYQSVLGTFKKKAENFKGYIDKRKKIKDWYKEKKKYLNKENRVKDNTLNDHNNTHDDFIDNN